MMLMWMTGFLALLFYKGSVYTIIWNLQVNSSFSLFRYGLVKYDKWWHTMHLDFDCWLNSWHFYLSDLSPQESTLLCDVIEVGHLPNFVPEDEKTRYAFYLLTRQGLKFECSSTSEIQVTESYCSEMLSENNTGNRDLLAVTDLHWIWSFPRLIHG